ncbi:MAG TPA: HEAT repeat domain-containing protein [Planctomycetota bacterium]|jgi:HEAT repeat protein|nr:HEAT repeat domain-containing protein [Planctomycetota bacterium]
MSASLLLLAFLFQYGGCGGGYGGGTPPPPPVVDPGPIVRPDPNPAPGDRPVAQPNFPGSTPPASGPPGPTTPTPPPRTGGQPGPRTGGGLDLGPPLDWRDWWWLNAYDYLRPKPRCAPFTGDGETSTSFDRELEAARETLRRALRDEDDRVRASAALTAGRLYEPSLHAPLLAFLEDGNPLIRQSAIAGLGLAGTDEHVHLLLSIGIEGASRSARNRSVAERDLALLSLGIGARRGASPRFAPALRAFLRDASPQDRFALGPSAAASLGLVRDASPFEELAAVARDAGAPAALRARALWALGRNEASAAAVRPAALACLRDRVPDVRRAAALALGHLAGGAEREVLAALRSAVDAEGDTAVRAFALLSMGEVGGPEGKRELLDRLTRGKQLLRPWAALGAGILGRKTPDPEIGRALARTFAEERNQDSRAALVLALGLAKAADAREAVRRTAIEGAHGRERLFAALAVALGEDEGGRSALRRMISDIPSPATRATVALALSTFGNMEDLPELTKVFRATEDPGVFGTVALALAWHGTPLALETLRGEAEAGRQAERRAVSLLALGIGVAPERVPSSVAATAGWDYLASLEAAHLAARLWM